MMSIEEVKKYLSSYKFSKVKVKNLELDMEICTGEELEQLKKAREEYQFVINKIDNAMDGLTEDEKNLIKKKFFDKMSIKNIQAEFNLSNAGVYKKINRILSAINL